MAKQNFISGGYYGKLGATVGQRWKNKRTIRTYVKPANPRTEKQQANRKLFGKFTERSQLGMQMNYYSSIWKSTTNTQWALRMSTASKLYKQNQKEMNLIPLFPSNYTPTYNITKMNFICKYSNKYYFVQIEGNIPENDDTLSILAGHRDENNNFTIDKLILGFSVGLNSQILRIDAQLDDNLLNTSEFLLVTSADISSRDTIMYGSQQSWNYKERSNSIFDASIKSFSESEITFSESTNKYNYSLSVTFNQAYESFENYKNVAEIVSIKNGTWNESFFSNVTFENDNGFFKVTFDFEETLPQNIPAFPKSSYVGFTNMFMYDDTKSISGVSVFGDIISENLTRQYKSKLSSVELENNLIKIYIEDMNAEPTSFNGTVTTYAQQSGSFTTVELTPSKIIDNIIYCEQPTTETSKYLSFPSGSTISINVSYLEGGITYDPTITTAQEVPTT